MKTATLATLVWLVGAISFAADNASAQINRLVSLSDVSQCPLRQVIEQIAADVNLTVKYDQFVAMSNQTLDTPINANLPSISAAHALSLILKPLDLEYEVSDGRIVVFTAGTLRNRVSKVEYSVADLVENAGGSAERNDLESLVKLIVNTVALCSGDDDWITPNSESQTLTIRQTASVHQQIEALLAQLRGLREQAPGFALKRKIDISFHDASLATVLGELSRQCETNIFISPECGNPTISCEAHDKKGADVLLQILYPLGLRSKIGNEAVTISADKKLFLKTYSVADLVPAAKDGTPDFQPLIERITADVAPLSWNAKGGNASIESFTANHSLIVSQNERGHEQVAELLQSIRAR